MLLAARCSPRILRLACLRRLLCRKTGVSSIASHARPVSTHNDRSGGDARGGSVHRNYAAMVIALVDLHPGRAGNTVDGGPSPFPDKGVAFSARICPEVCTTS